MNQRPTTIVDIVLDREHDARIGFSFLPDLDVAPLFLRYGELARLTQAVAARLQADGLQGERALLMFPSGLEFVTAFFGCLVAGVVAVPAYPPRKNQSLDRLTRIIGDARPRVVLTTRRILETAREQFGALPGMEQLIWIAVDEVAPALAADYRRPWISSDDLAFLQYTSGSTGTPKGVMVSHGNILANVAMMRTAYDLTPEDVGMAWVPVFHDMGLFSLVICPLVIGYPVTCMAPAAFLQKPIRWLRALTNTRASISVAANFAFDLAVSEVPPEQRVGLDLASLRFLLSGGEPVRAASLERFYATYAAHGLRREALYPAYGLAEATVFVAGNPAGQGPVIHAFDTDLLEQHRASLNPAGRPLVGHGSGWGESRIAIVDPEDRIRLPDGQMGEIWVTGPHIAQGYWHRPEESAATFAARLSDSSDETFLRTGDLGFFLDGQLYIGGREKDLIIVHGANHYPQDIELTVQEVFSPFNEDSPPINGAAAAAFSVEIDGAERLVIAVEVARHYQRHLGHGAEAVPPPQDLAAVLRATLAASHELQLYDLVLLRVGGLPRTSSGKVQRRRCRELYLRGELPALWAEHALAESLPEPDGAETPVATPRQSEIIGFLKQALSRQLGIPSQQINPQRNLAEYGLDSVRVMRVTGELEEYLGRRLPVTLLWDHPNITTLAEHLAEAREESPRDRLNFSAETSRIERNLPFPLSDSQQAYWFGRDESFELGNISTHYYVEFDAVDLDLPRLNQAWNRLVVRHDMLRAIITDDAQQQILAEVPAYDIAVRDLVAADEASVEAELQDARRELCRCVRQTWPLFEIRAYHLPDGRQRLLFSIDLLIADVTSCVILFEEWRRLYDYPQLDLATLQFSYRDYVLADLSARAGGRYQTSFDYWKGRVPRLPPAPALPLARHPATIGEPVFTRRYGSLSADLWQALKDLARSHELTPSMLLCAAYAEVLSTWSRDPRFTLNVLVFHRESVHAEVTRIVGDFTALMLLEVDHSRMDSFGARAEQLQRQFRQELPHRHVSGIRVLRELGRLEGKRYASMPVVFTSYLGVRDHQRNEPIQSEWPGRQVFSLTQLPQVWLDNHVTEQNGELLFSWHAVEELFPDGLLDSMFDAFSGLLVRLAEDEHTWRWPVRLVPPDVKHLLRQVADRRGVKTDGLLHQPVLRRALVAPNAPALIAGPRSFSYGELVARSSQLARRLRSLGVRPNELVALVMEQGWEQVVAALAVAQAGGAWMSVYPESPPERLQYLLSHGDSRVVLTQSRWHNQLDWPEGLTLLCVDLNPAAEEDEQPLAPVQKPDDLAYVLFTSDATGFPKAAMLTHGGVANTIAAINERFEVRPGDRMLSLASLATGLTVYDIFGVLGAGGTVVLAEQPRDPAALGDALAAHGITLWNSVPSHLEALIEHDIALPQTLRVILLSGDRILIPLIEELQQLLPDAEIVSLGGAREASIWSVIYAIEQIDPAWTSIPYGKPLRNQSVMVLNDALEPCPIWVSGQIYIGGAGLGRGYWKNPEQTRARFFHHPLTGERFFRTGDLGRYLPDGNIEILGRIDQQIKLAGHRIELGEIEVYLRQFPAVRQAVVDTTDNEQGRRELIAYIVSSIDLARVRWQADVSLFAVDGRSTTVEARSLSGNGVTVAGLPEDWPAGLVVSARLTLADEDYPIDLSGMVSWRHGEHAGIEFHEPPERLRPVADALNRLMTGHQPPFRLLNLALGGTGGGRTQVRAPLNQLCRVRLAGREEWVSLMAVNLSVGGVYLNGAKSGWWVNQLLEIELDTDAEPLLLPGRIAWLAGRRLGVEFIDLDPARSARLSQIVAAILREQGYWFSRHTITDLVDELLQHLPMHMVPTQFLLVDALPVDHNGNVARAALGKLRESIRPRREHQFQAPRNPLERTLVEIYASLLGLESLGIHDNFFDLGGDSVLAARLKVRIQQALDTRLRLRDIFETATVASLAEKISGNQEAGQHKTAPLSPAQARLWFLDQLEGATPLYNISVARRVSGVLDVEALRRAFEEIIRRHEMLRTTFPTVDGQPVQWIGWPEPWKLPPENVAESELRRVVEEEFRRPFNLAEGPLLRTRLLRLKDEEHVLLVVLHHIVTDGWSMGVLVSELSQLYAAFSQWTPSPLAPLPLQYADYAKDQAAWLAGPEKARQVEYWRQRLHALPVLELPKDHPRPPVQTYEGARLYFGLPASLTDNLRQRAREHESTLFMLLLAGFFVLLKRYSGQTDLCVGTPIAGRGHSAVQSLIGLFVNTLALRCDLSGDPSFTTLLARMRETTLGAYAHQDLPFEQILSELDVIRDMSLPPLVQVMFVLQNTTVPDLALSGVQVGPVAAETQTAKFDLLLEFSSETPLSGFVEYNTVLFEKPTVRRLVEHYKSLLSAIAVDPARRLSALPLLTESERQQLVTQWNNTRIDYSETALIHQQFEAQAEQWPSEPAILFEQDGTLEPGVVSYAELNARANQLGRRLRALGIGVESRVAICLERSPEMVVGLLGILKAGGAYVPIDPGYPPDRIAYILQDAAAPVLLTQRNLAGRFERDGLTILALDDPQGSGIANERRDAFPCEIPDNALAYIIYTSGSTGKPKGAMNTHAAIRNRLLWMQATYQISADDCVLQKTPFGFDVSVWEFFWPLLVGARLALARPDGHRDPAYLCETIIRHGVTTIHFVPSMLQAIVEETGFASCHSLERVIVSGEALPPDLIERFYSRQTAQLHNLYGPTEAAVDVTAWPCERGRQPAITPIGRPIANLRIYILDDDLNPAPVGITGQLYIAGIGLARGYWQRPDLTARAFVPDPFAQEAGSRMYCTGDLARWRADGAIEYLGRADFQIKIRGFRIELAEIEAAIAGHESVRECAVVAFDTPSGDKRLVAYVVPGGYFAGELAANLKAALADFLPEFMIPAHFVVLPNLPLTANGKLDRRALPAPQIGSLGGRLVGPRTPTERKLCAIFCEVLELQQVGVEDNFFELGGHSLLATKVVARLNASFASSLSVRDLFEAPTVLHLAGRVGAEDGHAEEGMPRLDRAGPLPLSPAQRRLWFLDRLVPGNTAYNMPGALRLAGRLRIDALKWALGRIVDRHEALRSHFLDQAGEPYVRMAAMQEPDLPIFDLSGEPPAVRGRALHARCAELAGRPFDLAAGPLLRAELVRLDTHDHVLVVVLHHIIADGWSVQLLLEDLGIYYRAHVAGQRDPLPPLVVQYVDWVSWQAAHLDLDRHLEYWRNELQRVPPLALPTDQPRPTVLTYAGATHRFELPRTLAQGMEALAQRHGCSIFMAWMAVYAAVLARHAQQDDFCIGIPVAGRNRIEIEPVIGFFVNTLPIRLNWLRELSFVELLLLLRGKILAAQEHQAAPLEEILAAVDVPRDRSTSPLFQALFVVQQQAREPVPNLPDLAATLLELDNATAKYPITLELREAGERWHGRWEYNTTWFGAERIATLTHHFINLAAGAIERPGERIAELPMLQADEVRRQIVLWNETVTPYPRHALAHQLFEERAARTPDAIACIDGETSLSYRDLNRRANQLAAWLRDAGIGPEQIVGIAARGPALLIAMLGTLKAGGAFLPLDPTYPTQRLSYMLDDAAVSWLVVQHEPTVADGLPLAGRRTVSLAGLAGHVAGLTDHNPLSGARPDHLAYVIYTSGSTGQPKGVLVPHRGLTNLQQAQIAAFGLKREDRVLQFASPSFDAAVAEIFVTLCGGATLVFPSLAARTDPQQLAREMAQAGVSMVTLPPSLLAELDPATCPGLSTVISAGEALPADIARRWADRRLINAYGPTEITVCASAGPVTAESCLSGPPGIGRPIQNLRTYVLDRQLQPVPQGAEGELFVAGVGVARGYLGRADLTAERFVPDPFGPEPGSRMYRTGDRCRWRQDGTLEWLGRLDQQIKLRGFRIELAEVENALQDCVGVKQAVVVVAGSGDRQRLLGFVVADAGCSGPALRQILALRLPEFLLPAQVVLLEELPKTANGKIDRRALADYNVPTAPRTPPRNATESRIAAIWAEVLGIPEPGMDDNFFDLGGHSLLATRVTSRLAAEFGVDITLADFFSTPTIAGLEHQLTHRKAAAVDDAELARLLDEIDD